jgi:polyhydroxyalkanoate synthase subunit PhaE
MSENNSWTDQWFKAQQQFVDAWSDMARSSTGSGDVSQTELWSQGFELWRKACSGELGQVEAQQAMNKCFDMGKSYYAMGEQIMKGMSEGANPAEAINAWMEQLKQPLNQFASAPDFDVSRVSEFMQQWFAPNSAWQQMVSNMLPMQQAAWQFPGMNTSVFNLGEAVDPLGKILEAPGIGYFREPQEKQQRGLQLAAEYHQANMHFNQAFLRVALESIEGFQERLRELGLENAPKSLRELYDLWVDVSESHYAEFAMSSEYQELYGEMVNRLMVLRRHYNEITDDMLGAMNLPNRREIDTMQERQQQLRRENIALKREIAEIRNLLGGRAAKAAKPTAKKAAKRKPAAPAAAATKKAAPRKQASAGKSKTVKSAATSKAKSGA